MSDERQAHQRALELTVAAIDFELEPDERARLTTHLDACPTCRRASSLYAADERAMEVLPAVSAPDRVEARVLGTTRDRAGRPAGRGWLLTIAAAAGLVAIGGLLLQRLPGLDTSAGAPPATTRMDLSAAPGSPAPRSPAPVSPAPRSAAPVTPTPATPTTPDAGPLDWRSVAVPAGQDDARILATFAEQGLAIATVVEPSGEAGLWTSREGGPWQDTELLGGAFGGSAPFLVVPFGDGFVALGWADVARSETERRIWVSPDGLAWRANVDPSASLGSFGHGLAAASDDTILVGGRSATGETMIWRSTDGVVFSRLTVGDGLARGLLGGVVSDGSSFFAFGELDGAVAMWRTDDGSVWTALEPPPESARVIRLAASPGGLLAQGATRAAPSVDTAIWRADGQGWVDVPALSLGAGDRVLRFAGSHAGLLVVWQDGYTSNMHAAHSSDGRSWAVTEIGGLPDGVVIDHVDLAGWVLIGLGRDRQGGTVAFAADLPG